MRAMQNDQTGENLFLRGDTLLGVCEGLGQDLGFNPNWIRIALGAGLLWNAEAMVIIYLALGVVVLISRLLFPAPKAEGQTPTTEAAAVASQADEKQAELPLAA